ncbi:MAG: hypothetical protein HY753_09725, partial [Nitrospirae bacterium]|nr:hypothetical protein [Nitrospirota bacterium]
LMSVSKPAPESEPLIAEPWETSPELEAKITTCEPEIRQYIINLKMYLREQIKLNKKLQREIIKLKVANSSLKNKSDVIEEENKYCAECERRMVEEAEEEIRQMERESTNKS